MVACIFLNIPKQGNISSGYAFSLIGISPPPGSPAGALLSCDGLITLDLGRDASIIIFSACCRSVRLRRAVTRLTGWAEFVRHSHACSARRLPDSRRNVKDMLIFNCQGAESVCLMKELFYSLTINATTLRLQNGTLF